MRRTESRSGLSPPRPESTRRRRSRAGGSTSARTTAGSMCSISRAARKCGNSRPAPRCRLRRRSRKDASSSERRTAASTASADSMRSARWLVVLCAGAVLPAQSELPQIKKQMQQHLSRLANLTCLETIQRSTVSRNGRVQTNDTLRLEVAFVDGKELYSRLGAGKFDDRAIGEFGRGGAIESGLFATLAQFVFMKDGPTYRYSGEETLHGRKPIRYTYKV